jgi:hypothetical protein
MFDYKHVVGFDEIMLTSASGISNPIQPTNQSGLIEATNQPTRGPQIGLDWLLTTLCTFSRVKLPRTSVAPLGASLDNPG